MGMERLSYLVFLTLCLSLHSCDSNESDSEAPMGEAFVFRDGFETMNNDLQELFTSDGSRWTNLQQVNPTNAVNEVSVIDTQSVDGRNALRLVSYASDAQLSKIDIEKGGLQIGEGNKVVISANFFIEGTASLANLLLIDLECCSCWDPNVGDNYGSENQCPGVRLMMSGGNDYLSIERGKISGTTLLQTEVAFPRNQWVSVQWEMTISATAEGKNRLLINGTEVLNQNGMNLPNAQIFKEVFAAEEIDFVLSEPTFYERLQVGATANPTAGDMVLLVDDVSIAVE